MANESASKLSLKILAPYFLIGVILGITQVKTEVISFYRIQEMFHFQSFHMYGVIGSASLTAMITYNLLRKLGVRALSGEVIEIPPKTMGSGKRYAIGGAIFGVGWAMTGACPGPVFALIGSGLTVFIVTALSALMGTWLYGVVRSSLPG